MREILVLFFTGGIRLRFVHQIALVFLFFILSGGAEAQSSKIAWSFEQNPHPSIAEMSLREKLALLSIKKRYDGVDVSCRASLQSEYQIYLGRYPSYLSFQDEQDPFIAWKRHIAQNSAVQQETCLYGRLIFQFSELDKSTFIGEDFLFCNGQFPRSPRTKHERELIRLTDELTEYVFLGSAKAAIVFGRAGAYSRVFYAHPELRYYMLSFAHKQNAKANAELSRRLASVKKLISSERLEFLDEAVRGSSYKTVLDAMPDCRK